LGKPRQRPSAILIFPMTSKSKMIADSRLPGSGNGRLTRRLLASGCVLLFAAAVFQVCADTTRTQTIQLSRGWNAVFLEVYPLESDPTLLFKGTSVDIVASYYAHVSTAQFIGNPAGDLFKKQGWGVWYAPSRADAFLKSLHSIYGQQGYLIHAKSDYTLNITGGAVPTTVSWVANEYNFVGFSVRASGAPTFTQFFDGSSAHNHNKIYRLTDGAWRRVLDPTAESMKSGEAFWIYCDGASKYSGPLAVETLTRGGLFVGAGGDDLTLRNQTGHPVTATVEHVPSGTNAVPLSLVIQLVGAADTPVQSVAVAKPDGPWTQSLPPMEAGTAMRMPFEVRGQDLRVGLQSSLLKISTDLGTETWIPVVTTRKDLEDK